MQILCLGLSHHTAPVELRERLAYPHAALQAALARCGCGRDAPLQGVAELVILSTCNRLELYAAVSGLRGSAEEEEESALFSPLLSFIAETRSMPMAEFKAHLYHHEGKQAVEHLCRVAAGLDSMILGEPQVLGQVTEAYQAALGQGAIGPILSALFRTAIRVGKRARTETAISRNPSTVGSVAVKLAGAVVGDLASAHVLILGTGEMAELAVEALRARGASHIVVVSRTQERAMQLAQRWGAQALTFEQLAEALAAADIVIASTAAPHVLVTPDLAHAAIARRPGRPLIFIDIAVPRNIDPDVSRLSNVHCYDIDDLQARLNGALAEREREIPRVEAIAAEEASAFMDWLRSLDVAALIAELRVRADALRRAEVEKTLRHLPRLDETERQRIEALAESLVNKLLHAPTLRLKAEAGNGHAAEYAAAARYLFALDS
jgi:glutamyl-tRNA reductase